MPRKRSRIRPIPAVAAIGGGVVGVGIVGVIAYIMINPGGTFTVDWPRATEITGETRRCTVPAPGCGDAPDPGGYYWDDCCIDGSEVLTKAFSGKADPGMEIKIYANNKATPLGSTKADTSGAWSIPGAILAEGDYSIIVVGELNNNIEELRVNIAVDTTAPVIDPAGDPSSLAVKNRRGGSMILTLPLYTEKHMHGYTVRSVLNCGPAGCWKVRKGSTTSQVNLEVQPVGLSVNDEVSINGLNNKPTVATIAAGAPWFITTNLPHFESAPRAGLWLSSEEDPTSSQWDAYWDGTGIPSELSVVDCWAPANAKDPAGDPAPCTPMRVWRRDCSDVPALSPYTFELPRDDLVAVEHYSVYVYDRTTDAALTVLYSGVPATGEVVVNQADGILTFHADEAGHNFHVNYMYAAWLDGEEPVIWN